MGVDHLNTAVSFRVPVQEGEDESSHRRPLLGKVTRYFRATGMLPA